MIGGNASEEKSPLSNVPALGSQHYGPTIARWKLPRVRVRQQGGAVTVEQRVPARVSNISVSSTTDSRGFSRTRRTYYYESGLGSDSRLPLVLERLTVSTSVTGCEQVEQAVKAAISSYNPGTAAPGKQWGPGMWGKLALAGFGVIFSLMAFSMLSTALRLIRIGEWAYGSLTRLESLILLVPTGSVVIGVLVAVIGLRSAWILRTPAFIAEEQWGLLRSVLTQMTGQQPGSSRPLDVEAGLRPDLITHPHGETRRRGVTLDGRMGPAWPDAYSIKKTVRKGRTGLIATSPFVAVVLGLLYFFCRGVAGFFNNVIMVSAILFVTGIIGIILVSALRACDRVLAAYPTQVPGEDAPRRIDLQDVDVDSLPGWCAARLRQGYWNAVSYGFWVLCGAGLLLLFIQLYSEPSTDVSWSPALFLNPIIYVGVVIIAATATIMVSAVRARDQDARRRRRIGQQVAMMRPPSSP